MEEVLIFEDSGDDLDPIAERERQLLARVYGEGFSGVLVEDFSNNEDGEPAKDNEFGLTIEAETSVVNDIRHDSHGDCVVCGFRSGKFEMCGDAFLRTDGETPIGIKGLQGSFRVERTKKKRGGDKWEE